MTSAPLAETWQDVCPLLDTARNLHSPGNLTPELVAGACEGDREAGKHTFCVFSGSGLSVVLISEDGMIDL
ncbi:hypothetical protein VZT92_023134 [Zoarces viviparus]|uniref:Uncharacterized protein n=1 Tax=Zoarces viviparus TaxID=48416 RepID=A0AAW1E5X3_ZOAVI